jgi:hypothetical protein
MSTRLALLLLAISAVSLILLKATTPKAEIEGGVAGVGEVDSTLLVAVPIGNIGTAAAHTVTITSASLGTAPILSPTTFPVSLGAPLIRISDRFFRPTSMPRD